MFVQGAGLLHVDEPSLVFGDAVAKFMPDDIERNGETVEQLRIAIAEYHPLPVPKGVVIFPAVMDRGIERQTFVIDRVPLVVLPEEIEGVTKSFIGLVDRCISAWGRAFATERFAR
jgi:hypothetical protein